MLYLDEIAFTCSKKNYNLFVNKKRKIYNFMLSFKFKYWLKITYRAVVCSHIKPICICYEPKDRDVYKTKTFLAQVLFYLLPLQRIKVGFNLAVA